MIEREAEGYFGFDCRSPLPKNNLGLSKLKSATLRVKVSPGVLRLTSGAYGTLFF